MGKLHKEIGQLIVQSAEDPEKSDGQVIQVTPQSSDLLRVVQWWCRAACGRAAWGAGSREKP